MKKFTLLILVATLLLGINSGCGQQQPETAPPTPEINGETETTPPEDDVPPEDNGTEDNGTPGDNGVPDATDITVGVSLLTREHVFYNRIEDAIQARAAELGIELIVEDAGFDPAAQFAQVENFINMGVDAIMLSPAASEGSSTMVELARDNDIPVFTMDIASDSEHAIAHVATDNYAGGRLAANYVATHMLPDGVGNVAIVTYSEVESTVNREQGFVNYMEENHPGIVVVDIQNSRGDQGVSADVTQNMLLMFDELDVIFGVGDPFAMGAFSSVMAAEREVQIIGFDGNPDAVEEIARGGLFVASIAQDPDAIGSQALDAVLAYLRGEPVEPLIAISPQVIDINTLE